MIKQILAVLIAATAITSCNNDTTPAEEKDKRIPLSSDTVNVVTMRDTMVIFESTCRGCAYEGSTSFDIEDTAGVVKLAKIITTDNNSSDMAGGNVSKDLVIVPQKIGGTTFKLYKSYKGELTAEDSARAKTYTVEVTN
jgi:hypothetical protein